MEKKSPFFASEYRNAQRLNQAADELDRLHGVNATIEQQVMHLLRLDRDQGHEIAKLQAAVYVLMQMLAENGLLDAEAMSTRMGAAFESLEADPAWQRMRGL
ncbi:MAG TPA: hypothetical protein VIF62_33570 [Labilithrix sp.]